MYFACTHSRLVANQKWRFYLESETNIDGSFFKKKTQNRRRVKKKPAYHPDPSGQSGFSMSPRSPKELNSNESHFIEKSWVLRNLSTFGNPRWTFIRIGLPLILFLPILTFVSIFLEFVDKMVILGLIFISFLAVGVVILYRQMILVSVHFGDSMHLKKEMKFGLKLLGIGLCLSFFKSLLPRIGNLIGGGSENKLTGTVVCVCLFIEEWSKLIYGSISCHG